MIIPVNMVSLKYAIVMRFRNIMCEILL